MGRERHRGLKFRTMEEFLRREPKEESRAFFERYGFLLQREHDPIDARGIRVRTTVAGANREAAQVAAGNGVDRSGGQRLGMQAGIGEHSETFGKLMNGNGSELVSLCHRT